MSVRASASRLFDLLRGHVRQRAEHRASWVRLFVETSTASPYSPSLSFARPKSSSFTPFGVSITFPGLRSR